MELGSKVRDTITGFNGIAVARVEYLNGATQILVQPEAGHGKPELPKSEWIYESQIEEFYPT